MLSRSKNPKIRPVIQARRRLFNRKWMYLFGVLGPGIIAANAGNDAGGIATYATVGASYGYELCWMMVLITLCLFAVQEMCARMAAVTGKGLSDLIRENFGIRWTAFAMLLILIANGGTVVSEFVGIAAALELFGISRYLSVPVFAFVIWWIVVKGSYRKVEKVFLALTLPFLAYVITAFKANPDWHSVFHHTITPTFRSDAGYLMLFVATVGTTITPYMQIILQSTVAEKGVDIKHYRSQWWDVLLGTIFGNLISLFIIITTAATLHKQGIMIETAADAAKALAPLAGEYSKVLFAAGLFGASMLAAAVLPLSTSFSISEAFGWTSGIGHDFREAREFYTLFTVLIVFGASITLIPGLPLIKVLILVQTLNGVLLPVLLVFITRLASSRKLMNDYRSKGLTLIINWVTTVSLGLLAAWLVISTMLLPLVGIHLGK